MKNEFINYIEKKIAEGSPIETELNETLLSLYKKGFVHVEMREGEPFISVSDEGQEVYLSELALSFADVVEA